MWNSIPSLRFQAHLQAPQGKPAIQSLQKSLSARPTVVGLTDISLKKI
jgi:hypothetical protein